MDLKKSVKKITKFANDYNLKLDLTAGLGRAQTMDERERFKRDTACLKQAFSSVDELEKFVSNLGFDERNNDQKAEFGYTSVKDRQSGINKFYKINRKSFKASGNALKDKQIAETRIASYIAHSRLGLYQPGTKVVLSDLNFDPSSMNPLAARGFLSVAVKQGRTIAGGVLKEINQQQTIGVQKQQKQIAQPLRAAVKR